MSIQCGQRSRNLKNREEAARVVGSRSCQSKGPEKEARVTSKEDEESRRDGQEAKPPFFGWSTMTSGEACLLVLGARTECVSLEPSNQSNTPDRTLSLELVILKR